MINEAILHNFDESIEKFTKYGIIVLNRKTFIKKQKGVFLLKKYQVFYKEKQIGLLEVNEQGQHRYTANSEAVDSIKNEVPLIPEMLNGTDWVDPIPFFKERLDNGSRFDLTVIQYHTDLFKMVQKSE